MELIAKNLKDLDKIAQSILKEYRHKNCFYLNGDLGAGKTQFVRAIGNILNVEGDITSPSFTLVNDYTYQDGIIHHMDLYRINAIEELFTIGIEEYLLSGNLCFVEWPSLLTTHFSIDHLEINIEIMPNNDRKFIF